MSGRKNVVLGVLLVTLLAGLVYLRWIPNDYSLLVRHDSAMFLYAGQQLAQGAELYSEIWDHKPPLIFYLNRLGLAVGAGSPAGVLLLCFVLGLCFLGLTYATTAPAVGPLAALCGVLLSLYLLPDLAQTPNLTECYALPLQALSVWLLLREWRDGQRWWFAASQGGIGALLVHLRPNCAGVTLVYALLNGYRLVRQKEYRGPVSTGGSVALGFGAVYGVVLLPLWLEGAMPEFLYATFGFNLEYVGVTTLADKLRSLDWGWQWASRAGAVLLAAPVALAVALRPPSPSSPAGALALSGSLLFGVEAVLAAMSGRTYDHYFIPWLLPCAMLWGYFCHLCLAERGAAREANSRRRVLAGLVTVLAGLSGARSISAYRVAAARQEESAPIVRMMRAETSAADCVLIWGNGFDEIGFRLRRRPASRIFSTAPLTHGRAAYQKLAGWLLADLERNQPRYVIEVLALPELPPLFAGEVARQQGWGTGPADWDTAEMAAQKARLGTQYQVAQVDQRLRSVVYQRRS